VDVIGGGISGLASAYFLARSRAPVDIHVWEQDAAPGGLAGSFSTEYFTVEKFYHHLYRSDRALIDLIGDLGLSSDLEWRPASTGSYYKQQAYRLSSPIDLLKYKPLPLLDRLRLGWLMMHARRFKEWRQLDDMTAREYVTSVAGNSVYAKVWEPLLRGKFGANADSISAAWLWSKLVDRGGSRTKGGREVLGYLRGGLGRVFHTMVERLRRDGHTVNLACGVDALTSNGERMIEAIRTPRGTFETDFVVSGLQLPELVRLLPDDFSEYRTSLERIKYLGNVCLILTLNRSLSEFYWTNVTDPMFPFVGIIEQTRWADPATFSGKHLVYISAYLPHDDRRMAMETDALVDFYLPYLQQMFPDLNRSHIVDRASWRAGYAQPIVEVGYRHQIPSITTPIDNLLVCTMAQIYPHDRQVSNGVEVARKTAEALLGKLKESEARHAPRRARAV
jgi:protoporphyrinogen oxidase